MKNLNLAIHNCIQSSLFSSRLIHWLRYNVHSKITKINYKFHRKIFYDHKVHSLQELARTRKPFKWAQFLKISRNVAVANCECTAQCAPPGDAEIIV